MSLRAVRPPGRYETSEDVAQLCQRMRGEMLAWAQRRFPAPWDHEEVLQETLAVIAFDPGARGDEDHVRACLYGTFGARLRNRFRDERPQVVADAPLDADAVERIADPDPAIDPPTRALQAWHRAVVEDLLAGYSETERRVIRLRYRGGERARKMDGVVSRKQCAKMLGIELAQVRSIEDRVVRRLDAQIAAYDRTCQRREKEIELAARHAAGHELSDELLLRVEIGRRHLNVCGHCRHAFHEHRRQFASEIAVLLPLPLLHRAPLEPLLDLGRGLRRASKAMRDLVAGVARDPVSAVQLATPRGSGTALLAVCGLALGGVGVCQLAGVGVVDRATSAVGGRASTSMVALEPAGATRTTRPIVAELPGTRAFDVFLRANSAALGAADRCEACAERSPSRTIRATRSHTTTAPRESATTAAALAPTAPVATEPPPALEPQPPAGGGDPLQADACEACAERGGN